MVTRILSMIVSLYLYLRINDLGYYDILAHRNSGKDYGVVKGLKWILSTIIGSGGWVGLELDIEESVMGMNHGCGEREACCS